MSPITSRDVADLARALEVLQTIALDAERARDGAIEGDDDARRLRAENAALRSELAAARARAQDPSSGARELDDARTSNDAFVLNDCEATSMGTRPQAPSLAGFRTESHEFVVRDDRRSAEDLARVERAAVAEARAKASDISFNGRLSRFWSAEGELESFASKRETRGEAKAAFELALVNDESAHVVEPLDRKIRTKQKGLPHVKFSWLEAPKNAFLVKKIDDANATAATRRAIGILKSKGVTSWLEPVVYASMEEFAKAHQCATWDANDGQFKLEDVCDFVVIFGGDGTLLWSSKFFPRAMPPVVPFSMGSLGFLTAIKVDTLERTLRDVCLGDFTLTVRSRLMAKVVTKDGAHGEWEYCLNEVLIDRGPKAVMIELDLAVDGRHVTKIAADGCILSTPTGSTAYSLAAGGSVVHPGVPALCVTPICPHSLSFRPIILPDSVVVAVSCPMDARHTTWAAFDGQKQTELQRGDSLVVRVASFPVPVVCAVSENADWFDAIKQGLLWNARGAEQKPFLRPPLATPT